MKHKLILIAFLLPFVKSTFADSPITSTQFYTAYNDNEMVKKAAEKGVIDDEIAAFLVNSKNKIDVKVAVCNALSWSFDGKQNAALFADFLQKKYKDKYSQDNLSSDELLCMGYLVVLDDYFNPQKAIPLLEKAVLKDPRSYTARIILALTRAQSLLDTFDWCPVWKEIEQVDGDSKLRRELNDEAIKIIMDYMILYKDSCN